MMQPSPRGRPPTFGVPSSVASACRRQLIEHLAAVVLRECALQDKIGSLWYCRYPQGAPAFLRTGSMTPDLVHPLSALI